MAFMSASVSENIAEGILNMVAGLIIVFGVLIFLSLIISAFGIINKLVDKPQAAAAPAPAPAPAAVKSAPVAVPVGPGTMAKEKVAVEDEVEGPVAAAILAAVAQTCGGNFKVTSIRKHK